MTCSNQKVYNHKAVALRRLRKKGSRIKQFDIKYCQECKGWVIYRVKDKPKSERTFWKWM